MLLPNSKVAIENFLMTLLGQLKFEGSVLFKRIKYLISNGMNEIKHLCHDSSFCKHRGRKHLPVSSIVLSSSENVGDAISR